MMAATVMSATTATVMSATATEVVSATAAVMAATAEAAAVHLGSFVVRRFETAPPESAGTAITAEEMESSGVAGMRGPA